MGKTENVFKSTSNKIYFDCFKLNYPSSRLPRHRFNCHRMENHELQSVHVCFVSYIVSMLLFAFDIFFLFRFYHGKVPFYAQRYIELLVAFRFSQFFRNNNTNKISYLEAVVKKVLIAQHYRCSNDNLNRISVANAVVVHKAQHIPQSFFFCFHLHFHFLCFFTFVFVGVYNVHSVVFH